MKLNQVFEPCLGRYTSEGLPVPGFFNRRRFTVLRGTTWGKYYQRSQAFIVALSQLLPSWDFFFVSSGEMNVIRRQSKNLFIVSPLWAKQFEDDLAEGVFYTTWPRIASELLKARHSIFDVVDHPSLFYGRDLDDTERESFANLISRSSSVLLSLDDFRTMMECLMERKDAITVRNGCWPNNTALRPPCTDSAPTIGFWGCPGSWIDYDLLDLLARRFTVLVASDSGFPSTCKNVGYLPFDRLKWFAGLCTHLIVPFKDGPISRFADPIKQYEYAHTNRVSLIPKWIPAFTGEEKTNVRRYGSFEELVSIVEGFKDDKLKCYEEMLPFSWEERGAKIVKELFGVE